MDTILITRHYNSSNDVISTYLLRGMDEFNRLKMNYLTLLHKYLSLQETIDVFINEASDIDMDYGVKLDKKNWYGISGTV